MRLPAAQPMLVPKTLIEARHHHAARGGGVNETVAFEIDAHVPALFARTGRCEEHEVALLQSAAAYAVAILFQLVGTAARELHVVHIFINGTGQPRAIHAPPCRAARCVRRAEPFGGGYHQLVVVVLLNVETEFHGSVNDGTHSAVYRHPLGAARRE